MLEGDGVGIVRFNEDAQPLQPVLTARVRRAVRPQPRRHPRRDQRQPAWTRRARPRSATASSRAARVLDRRRRRSTVKALVVLTDGIENSPRWISDVAGEINETTYAVGLGPAAEHQRAGAADGLRQQRRLPAGDRRDQRGQPVPAAEVLPADPRRHQQRRGRPRPRRRAVPRRGAPRSRSSSPTRTPASRWCC